MEQGRQIVTGHVLDRLPSSPEDPPVGKHNRQPQYIIARNAVFQASRPACVAGNIAADRGMPDT